MEYLKNEWGLGIGDWAQSPNPKKNFIFYIYNIKIILISKL